MSVFDSGISFNFIQMVQLLSKLIFLCTLFLQLLSCSVYQPAALDVYSNHQIQTDQGPEDIVLDTVSMSRPRLLISCDNRRSFPASGCIQSMDLGTEKVITLSRQNEPKGINFHPHGIDVVNSPSGRVNLYVVNHDEAQHIQSILVYELKDSSIYFEKMLSGDLVISPNDVSATPEGKIIFGNEFHRRNANLAAILGLKTGYFVEVQNDIARKRERHYCYANGSAIWNKQLLTVGTRNAFLYASPLTFDEGSKRRKITRLKGADNISVVGDKAYVACHVSLLRFLKHAKDKANSTPTVVYEVDLISRKKKILYSNFDGTINGASTAIYYRGRLYLAQIFEPYILVVEAF